MYRYEDVLYASAFDDEWVGPGRLARSTIVDGEVAP